LEAAKNLKKLGLKQETISKVLLLEEVGFERLRQCPECNTMNMVFEKQDKFKDKDQNKEAVFHWYKCANCGKIILREIEPH